MEYSGTKTREISFPLGGIGTGCIGLAGNGGFRDIEIKSRPGKNTTGEFTHFAIKAEDENEVVDCRVLQGDMYRDYVGCTGRPIYTGYGFGPDRGTMAGFPHFEHMTFHGEYPIARLEFAHDKFPGTVQMTAFNPLIPTNEDDSSIPAAFFELEITNTARKKINYTVALSCSNFYCRTNTSHHYGKEDGKHYIFLGNTGQRDAVEYGDLTIATDNQDVSFQEYWFRGRWFDNSAVFWNEFSSYGPLKNRHYETDRTNPDSDNISDTATLAARIELEPGERKSVRFLLSWSNPYMNNFWDITHLGLTQEELEERRGKKWKNYYATLFETSRESALYGLKKFSELLMYTRRYQEAIFRSSLPPEALDAVTANISILKSPTCLRLEDGSFYAFEGVHENLGSCEGTCTHVWSYVYAPAFLFPKLERSARRLEYTYSMQPDGGMGFRLQLPLGVGPTNHRPAVDGQYGTVLRVYREFMISGDVEWLKAIWPEVKRSVEFAWSEKNSDCWDRDKDGIMEGRQHHTLDMELFGPNSWLSGMYLGGLAAAAKLAEVLGDVSAKEEYLEVFEKGKKQLNTALFNGQYFYQNVDLRNKEILASFNNGQSMHGASSMNSYWNEEAQEMKYQIAEGCAIDQVLGQWHADLLNLGQIFDKEKVTSALCSIYENNFVPDMREHVNPCRVYGMNDEQGTIICSYPEGKKKPWISVPYAEETMHGFEYQAASHMILHGLEQEGLRCVRAVRNRYDGEKRNPWNEMECGSNYARSMASYALLLVYSGFVFDLYQHRIGFHPLHEGEGRYFWSVDSGFGEVIFSKEGIELKVLYGTLTVKYLDFALDAVRTVEKNGEKLAFAAEDEVILEKAEKLKEGDSLRICRKT